MKLLNKILIGLLLTGCSYEYIDTSCEDYNEYINMLYDEKLEILFNSRPGKYDFKGEIKEIEKERWLKLRDC